MIFVLASNSPRRKELLALSGCEFRVRPADIDEGLRQDETAQAYVLRLAEEKARAASGGLPAGSVVIAADTTVVDPLAEPGREILAKPQDEAEAADMLRRLRGRTHQVYTGLAVLRVGGHQKIEAHADLGEDELRSMVCCTDVKMRPYREAELLGYIQSGDPFDKAGGYAIQHNGFRPVESVTGCYANVVGLPLCCLARLLEELDLPSLPDLPAACQADREQEKPIFRQIAGAPAPIPGI